MRCTQSAQLMCFYNTVNLLHRQRLGGIFECWQGNRLAYTNEVPLHPVVKISKRLVS